MRKFKKFRPRGSRFRSLLILAGALTLLGALTPEANAALIRYYNFEVVPPVSIYGVNLESQTPALETGAGTTLYLDNGTIIPGTNTYPVANTSVQPGIPLNVPGGAPPNLTSLGFDRSGQFNLGVNIPMPSSQGIYDVTSVSFAYGANGNGWAFVTLQISTDGGNTFATMAGTVTTALPATPGSVITFTPTAGQTLNVNNLVLRLLFTGGQSNGADLQFELDNIQIGGTIVPEPATVAGGLLGVLGLCWFQRRRLIRSVRFRRT